MNIIFTEHAKARIMKRKITEQEIIDIINYPDKIDKKHEQYYFSKKLPFGTIEVCCERQLFTKVRSEEHTS